MLNQVFIIAAFICFALGSIKPVLAESTIFQSPLVWSADGLGNYLFKDNGILSGTRIANDGAVEFVSAPGTYELSSSYQANAAISSISVTWRFKGKVSMQVSATGNSADYTSVTDGVPLILTKQSSGKYIKWRATLLEAGSKLLEVRISYADATGVTGSFGNPDLAGFNFQKTIWVDGSDHDLYHFQIPIDVGQSIKSHGDVILKGVLQSDFNDAYFTAADGQTPLAFYRDSISGSNSAQTARYWVRVPQIPQGGLPIMLFYGRVDSTDMSNPQKAFDFYYDFSESVFDDAKWLAADLSKGIIEYKLNSGNAVIKVDRKTLTSPDQIINFFKTGTGFSWVRQRKAAKVMPMPDAEKTAVIAEEVPNLPLFQGVALAFNGDVVLAQGQVQGEYISSFIYPSQQVRIMVPEWKTTQNPSQTDVDISAAADTSNYKQGCQSGTYYYASAKDFAPGQILRFKVGLSRSGASSLSPQLQQFSLDYRPGTISVISPGVGENVQEGSSYNIVWSALDYEPSYKMNIVYSFNGGDSYQTIAQGVPNSGNSLWQVPSVPVAQAKIRVIDALDNTVYGESTGFFSIVPSNGTVVTSPPPNQMTPAEASLNQEIVQEVSNPKAPRPGTKLYEILIKTQDAIPGNTLESAGAYKQGDIVLIAPAGYKWSATERSGFIIVQAYLLDSEVTKFLNPDMITNKDKSSLQMSPRRYWVDIKGQGLLNQNWQAKQQAKSSSLPLISMDSIQDKSQ